MIYDYFYGRQAEQYLFYKLPKILIKDDALKSISMDAKVLYSLMLDRAALSAENGWIDEDGRVYIIYTIMEICGDMCCGREKAIKLLKELETGCGLIRKKKQWLCRPDLIYVMNFATELESAMVNSPCSSKTETPEVRKPDSRESENQTSGGMKIETPGVRKSNSSKNNNNKTDNRDTDLIISGQMRQDENSRELWDHISERAEMRRYFYDRLDVPMLISAFPYDEERILEILELLTDVCTLNTDDIVVGQVKRPYSVVKNQLMKLESMHITYVLHSLEENSSDIRNIRQYLLTALYNAPMTMRNYYQTKVNHDMAYGLMLEEGDSDG